MTPVNLAPLTGQVAVCPFLNWQGDRLTLLGLDQAGLTLWGQGGAQPPVIHVATRHLSKMGFCWQERQGVAHRWTVVTTPQ